MNVWTETAMSLYQLLPSALGPVGCSTSPTANSAIQVLKYTWRSKPGQLKGKDNDWEDRQRAQVL